MAAQVSPVSHGKGLSRGRNLDSDLTLHDQLLP